LAWIYLVLFAFPCLLFIASLDLLQHLQCPNFGRDIPTAIHLGVRAVAPSKHSSLGFKGTTCISICWMFSVPSPREREPLTELAVYPAAGIGNLAGIWQWSGWHQGLHTILSCKWNYCKLFSLYPAFTTAQWKDDVL